MFPAKAPTCDAGDIIMGVYGITMKHAIENIVHTSIVRAPSGAANQPLPLNDSSLMVRSLYMIDMIELYSITSVLIDVVNVKSSGTHQAQHLCFGRHPYVLWNSRVPGDVF